MKRGSYSLAEWWFALSCLLGMQPALAAQDVLTVKIAYLSQEKPVPPALSNLDPIPRDKGVQGARLGMDDNNTTGAFTGQRFALEETIVPLDGDVPAAFQQLAKSGYRFIVTNLSAEAMNAIAGLDEAKQVLILDAGTRDDALRNEQCRPNILHMLPSRAMRADALAQYLLKKRWSKWLLVVGPSEEDRLYAAAVKRAAKRFGMKIVDERPWKHNYDARRTAQSEVPVFTQGVEYDVLIVADEAGLFGEYLSYRTWLPRPVAGTQGLTPSAWHRTHEQWGAVQIQERFKKQAGRWMEEEDYGAYLAIRAIGEAATRTQSGDLDQIKEHMLGDRFALQGYKGVPLTFRRWNGQLRQPVLLAADRSMVSVAPLEGFLHPRSKLDTLGFDEPESGCDFK